jgi:hypothetical protein
MSLLRGKVQVPNLAFLSLSKTRPTPNLYEEISAPPTPVHEPIATIALTQIHSLLQARIVVMWNRQSGLWDSPIIGFFLDMLDGLDKRMYTTSLLRLPWPG